MKTTLTYLKNSNTNDLIVRQEFTDTPIKGIPIYFYRDNKEIEPPDLKGYLPISEKHYKKLIKKRK